MIPTPVQQPSPSLTTGDDDTKSSNHSTTLPLSLDSLATTSSPSSIPPGPVKLTARSCLYEICAKSHWNRPTFDCFHEEGASNRRSFIYKVTIEMKEGSEPMKVVESVGKPQSNKKNAAESAAEGALWYLVQLGYPKKKHRPKKLRPITGDDHTKNSNHSTTPPVSLDSLATTSSPSSIPPGPVKLTARSCLYEICAKSHWNRPTFDCFHEEGASNRRSFIYKVTIEMKEGSEPMKVVESIGKPQSNKKNAAESAAEGALWYLVQLGYPKKKHRPKKLR